MAYLCNGTMAYLYNSTMAYLYKSTMTYLYNGTMAYLYDSTTTVAILLIIVHNGLLNSHECAAIAFLPLTITTAYYYF